MSGVGAQCIAPSTSNIFSIPTSKKDLFKMTKRKMLQISMVIVGAIAVIKGEFNLTRNRRMTKSHGRITGVILLVTGLSGGLIALVGLIGALAYGLLNSNPDDKIHRV
jgi:hypothetical protein